jgi:hypothetical protein
MGTVCSNLATVNHSLTSLSTITATTTVGEVQTMHSHASSALDRVVVLVHGSTAPMATELQTANAQLATTLKSYPATTTMGQTSIDLNALKSQATAAQGKATQLATTLKCPA